MGAINLNTNLNLPQTPQGVPEELFSEFNRLYNALRGLASYLSALDDNLTKITANRGSAILVGGQATINSVAVAGNSMIFYQRKYSEPSPRQRQLLLLVALREHLSPSNLLIPQIRPVSLGGFSNKQRIINHARACICPFTELHRRIDESGDEIHRDHSE